MTHLRKKVNCGIFWEELGVADFKNLEIKNKGRGGVETFPPFKLVEIFMHLILAHDWYTMYKIIKIPHKTARNKPNIHYF